MLVLAETALVWGGGREPKCFPAGDYQKETLLFHLHIITCSDISVLKYIYMYVFMRF